MIYQVPYAAAIFDGDINKAVIKVQELAGVSIDKAWWDTYVGNDGTADQILDRFDNTYRKYVAEIEKKYGSQSRLSPADILPSSAIDPNLLDFSVVTEPPQAPAPQEAQPQQGTTLPTPQSPQDMQPPDNTIPPQDTPPDMFTPTKT